jgi:DNA-binding IclR family transcriptional regulator
MARATTPVARETAGKGKGARARREPAGEPRIDQSAIEAVDRAGRILFALAASPRESSLLDVANRAGLSKPTAFRILATLVAEGLASQNPETASYRLGVLPLGLANAVLQSIPVRAMALSVMTSLRDKVNETVVLAVRDHDFRVNVESVEALNTISQSQQIGVPIPLYAGATSRVFLAAMEPQELSAYLDRTQLQSFSDTTITERARLEGEIERVRKHGFAISSAEFTVGGVAVARIIRDRMGQPLAAMHISIPRSRATEDLIERCTMALQAGVETLERAVASA